MKKYLSIALPLAALIGTLALAQQAKPDMVEKVKASLPKAAPAKPKAKRSVLVFSKTMGFRHSSIPIGIESMKLMGESTGAFTVTATEDENAFEPDNLKQYDGVIFLNTTGDVFKTKGAQDDAKEARLKQSLLDFVNGGKGLIGMHAATDTYANWKEYHDMMGGVFSGHPWHERVGIKNNDPTSPINKIFGGKDTEIVDEMYQWRVGSFSTDNHRVLLSLDTKNITNMNKRGTNGPDALYPVTVTRQYGKGRVFYCSLGHREEIYWNPVILEHFLAGIQFALGDLEAPADPKNIP